MLHSFVAFHLLQYFQTSSKKFIPTCKHLPFTLGETYAFFTMFGLIVLDFTLRYICQFSMFGIFHDSSLVEQVSPLAVSQSGMVGCLLGILLATWFIPRNWALSRVASAVVTTLICIEKVTNISYDVDETDNAWIPTSLKWLLQFFYIGVEKCTTCNLVNEYEGKISDRFLWILYWLLVLCVTFPLSIIVVNQTNEKPYSNNQKPIPIVIARKCFHFVAIALFLPVSLFSVDLMALSYAIACALLLLIEAVRYPIASVDSFEHKTSIKKDDTMSYPHIKAVVNSFYAAFLDQKDKGGAFVVTHTCLILGCAIPCWTYSFMTKFGLGENDDYFILLCVIGIIVVGVGDSFGAIIGSKYGRTKWPNSDRSVEGSLAMFLSMMSVVNILIKGYSTVRVTLVFALLTFLEAATVGIDNFVLPMAGASLYLSFVS